MKDREKLITDNMGLVRYIVKGIEAPKEEYDDLVSEGTIGLIKAAQTYDENKEIKFSTYSARCIKNQILMYLRKENKHKNVQSLDDILNEDNDGKKLVISDLIADERNYYQEREMNETLENVLNWILNIEDSRIRTILLLESAGIQQKVIGEKLNISQSYISRIQGKMRKKLKKIMDGKKIYNPKCKFIRKEGFFVITFYKKNIRYDEKTFNKINNESKKLALTYFDLKQLDEFDFKVILMEEENSMIFLANLLNQIA